VPRSWHHVITITILGCPKIRTSHLLKYVPETVGFGRMTGGVAAFQDAGSSATRVETMDPSSSARAANAALMEKAGDRRCAGYDEGAWVSR